jgi:uncharacterized protein
VDPGPLRDALTVALGVVTGVLSGAFGVGGAIISTPGIRALGASALIAIGSTLPSILPSAISGTVRYSREHLIDWRAVAWATPTGAVASVVGSLVSRRVPGEGHALMLLTAGLLIFTSVRMISSGRAARRTFRAAALAGRDGGQVAAAADAGVTGVAEPLEHPPAPRPGTPWRLVLVGTVAGLMSGLLGIGGGVIMVPGFTAVAGMPLKVAIATSLACVGAFALPGTITHAAIGNIDWRLALWLAVGVVPGARLGAVATIRAAEHRLRLTVGLFLAVIASFYAVGEALALLEG